MADERGFWDRILEGVDLGDYNPSNWSGEDIWNTISPFAISQIGKDEDVGAIYDRLSPEEKQAFHDRQKGINVTTEKPFISVSRTGEPRSQVTPMPTREEIISRLLASGRGPNITQGGGSPQTREGPSALKRIGRATKQFFGDAPEGAVSLGTVHPTDSAEIKRRRVAGLKNLAKTSPRAVETAAATTAAVNKRQKALELARKRSLAERERVKAEAARKGTQKAVSTMLKDRQTAPDEVVIKSARKAEAQRKIDAARRKKKASEIAKTKETRKAVGTMLKDRQTAPDEVVIESARKAEAKRKAAKLKRKRANELKTRAADKKIAGPAKFLESRAYKTKPTVVTEKKITKVKPKVVKKVAKEKKTAPIEADLGTGRKAHTVKSGQTLSGIAKQHGTTLKALLAANPKLKGRPNLIKVGEKIKIRGPLKKAASPYKGMTKKEWEKVTTASKKQREKRSARKTGGIVKKAGGGKMKQVGLHTAEMRSGGKDLHQPQSKIKKRIHEETTYAKKGGKVGKKKQGYKARKDESIAMRVKKKRTKKQLKASRNESYGKWGKGKGKGKINRSGAALVASSYD